MALKVVDGEPFTLVRDTGDLAEGAAAMRAALPGTTLKAVLAGASRTLTRKAANAAFTGMKPQPVDWYGFEKDDNDTPDWYPQGVACASAAGRSEPVIAVSWYWKPTDRPEKGIRLSFLDIGTRRYAHVLLVRPAADGTYRTINIHAGGIAWSGDLIYVADTKNGLRVFDLRNLIDLKSTKTPKYLAYRYLLPQVDHWRPVAGGPVRFSFAAIDRTHDPDVLLSGEYVEPGGTGRVARWPLGGDHRLVAGEDGAVRALDAYALPANKIQGALSHQGRWYLSQARDSRTRGSLLVVDAAGKVTKRDFPVGPEDLSCWRQRKTLWSVTEFRGRRAVFAVPL